MFSRSEPTRRVAMTTQLAVAILVAVASACATAGTQTYNLAPAQSQHVTNEVTVTGASDIVWDRLVAQLSRGFYVINNIDKASERLLLAGGGTAPFSLLPIQCIRVSRFGGLLSLDGRSGSISGPRTARGVSIRGYLGIGSRQIRLPSRAT